MSTNKSKSEISDNTIDGALSHANVIKDNGKIESQQNNNTVSDKENNNQIIQGNSNNIYQINETPPQENISVEIKVSKIYQASNLLDSSVDKSEKIENLKEETDIEFIITGSIKNTRHKRKVKAIEKLLQELGCDPTLVIDDVDEGSLKFVLKGSPEGLERIERLFNSGELTEIFDVPIESVEFIGPEKEKLAFTIAGDISYTDVAKLKTAVTGVDETELLIQKIRPNKGDKKLNFSRSDLNKIKMSILNVTNNTITLNNEIYQVRNITAVGKYRIKPNYFFKLNFIIICVILSLIGIELMKSNPDVKWFTFSVIFLAACGIIERFTKSKRYGIAIETNAGMSKLLISKDKSLINRILNTIAEIMNNQDKPANYTFKVSNEDVVNQNSSFAIGFDTKYSRLTDEVRKTRV
ncbi:DUF6232 family protein [Okeania sp. KiyG1]|uniref:DUF6232 family protein n=1 Tax=Okeania sp. KiyG1 TaxID=2720165 RepID=UPI0019227B2F|nr:DUF6232 family protein [Okeania sp. KiyG1]GGA37618.1 hypothetical protein CYANOKiyG1_55650 [Okeania sp. KiyG1]